jgi:hypothetical protein
MTPESVVRYVSILRIFNAFLEARGLDLTQVDGIVLRDWLEYWHATWRHGKKVCNFYLGSCKKLAREQALQKAMKLKAEDLGIRPVSMT